jgi:hypothetical protein
VTSPSLLLHHRHALDLLDTLQNPTASAILQTSIYMTCYRAYIYLRQMHTMAHDSRQYVTPQAEEQIS